MGLRRTLLVLYIFIIFHLQHNFPYVNSRPSYVDTYYESLSLRTPKPDVVGFDGKGQELAVVTKGGGGGDGSTGIGGGGGWRGAGGTGIGGGRELRGWFGGGGGLRGWFGRGGRLRGWIGGRGGGGGGGWRRNGGGNGIGGGGGLPGGGGGLPGGGGGLPGGGGGGRGSTGKGGVGSLIPIPTQTGGRGTGGFRRSNSSRNIQGGFCAICWSSLLVLAGLLLV